jgi:hypothetical protein
VEKAERSGTRKTCSNQRHNPVFRASDGRQARAGRERFLVRDTTATGPNDVFAQADGIQCGIERTRFLFDFRVLSKLAQTKHRVRYASINKREAAAQQDGWEGGATEVIEGVSGVIRCLEGKEARNPRRTRASQ